jgi:signal transduction histidine kinase
MLDDLGLRAALEWHVRDISRRCGVDVELAIEGNVDTLPDRYQTCVYRVLQEALTNCVRHAKARRIGVNVTAGSDVLNISAIDDGVGFEPGERRDGLGLRGMRERVKEIGGVLTIKSSPGRGTTLAMQLPLPAPIPEVRLARVAG